LTCLKVPPRCHLDSVSPSSPIIYLKGTCQGHHKDFLTFNPKISSQSWAASPVGALHKVPFLSSLSPSSVNCHKPGDLCSLTLLEVCPPLGIRLVHDHPLWLLLLSLPRDPVPSPRLLHCALGQPANPAGISVPPKPLLSCATGVCQTA
jgi:hypothetical protein